MSLGSQKDSFQDSRQFVRSEADLLQDYQEIAYSNYFCRKPDIGAVGTFFNVYSCEKVLGRTDNSLNISMLYML